MKSDLIAILGIIGLSVIYSVNPKVGGALIAIVVLSMLIRIEQMEI